MIKTELGCRQSVPDLQVRAARPGDLPAIEALIAHFTADGSLLPRSRADLLQHLSGFRVAAVGDRIVACGALQPCDEKLAEIRTIAVLPGWRTSGLGYRIVAALLADARRQGLTHVALLTRREDFFARHGFTVVPKEQLPPQFWAARPPSASRHRPDKVAMELHLSPRAQPELVALP